MGRGGPMGGRPFGGPPSMRGRGGMMRGGPPRGMGFRFVVIKPNITKFVKLTFDQSSVIQ